jgi:predicted DCC family thiol-disulfide oxidoreductase YuxK
MAEMPSVSMRLAAAVAYSYRADSAVPQFDDGRALIVYDGVCVLCSGAMRAIARRDRDGVFQFASAQSPLGRALFVHYGLDPVAFETVLLIRDGHAFGKLDMTLEVARVLGGPWRLFGLFRPLPRRLQDVAYDLVAKNRYRLFGRTATCLRPDASWRGRVIDHPAE